MLYLILYRFHGNSIDWDKIKPDNENYHGIHRKRIIAYLIARDCF